MAMKFIRPISRRQFIGVVAASGAAAGLVSSGFASASQENIDFGRALMAPLTADLDILNYALTLEHLEAELYRQLIATGFLSGKELAYVQQFGAAEQAHADAITATIRQMGGTPVQKLAKYNFPAVQNRGQLINVLAQVEEVGVGAYQGATDKIENKQLLTTAGGIMQVEARHAAFIRYMAGAEKPVTEPFTKSLTMEAVLAIVKPFLGQ